MDAIDPAATAWLLASTALVLLMTPGLAIFYGGMVRTTGVLNMIMMSFISIPLCTVAWLLVGLHRSRSPRTRGGGLVGNLAHIGMLGIDPTTARGAVPELLFATFQLGFAIVTAALVSGAIADRAKFAAWMVFVPLWTVAVYAVVAHWVWAPGGWLFELGVLDYAGGLVVEIVSGMSALALALVLGPRIGFNKDAMRPHNLPFVLLGCGLLWFGWFGFNAGSALAANGMASAVFLNTLVAGCLGMLGWITVEQVRDGRPTTFGAASGVIAGLVAITPSCGTVNTLGAASSAWRRASSARSRSALKFRFGYDDSLDVVGVHFVGGVVGVLLIGFLATEVMTGGATRPLLWRRIRTARQAGAGGSGRWCIRVRRVLRVGQGDRPTHGLPRQRRGRDHRRRLHPARRDRLRRGRARASAGAPRPAIARRHWRSWSAAETAEENQD